MKSLSSMSGPVWCLLVAAACYFPSLVAARCFDGNIKYCSWMTVVGSEAFVYDGFDFRVTSDDNYDWGRHKANSMMPPSDPDCSSTGSMCWAPGKEVFIEFHADSARVKLGPQGQWERFSPSRRWTEYPYDCIEVQFHKCN
ncbi:hypothetical protein BGZ73_000418 [Actinomortierella ambigua]|nr:hypothetical protein BGZ73_000418 [Actinomortierella ambigua]